MIFDGSKYVGYKFVARDELINLLEKIPNDSYVSCSRTGNMIFCRYYSAKKVEYLGVIDMLIGEVYEQ